MGRKRRLAIGQVWSADHEDAYSDEVLTGYRMLIIYHEQYYDYEEEKTLNRWLLRKLGMKPCGGCPQVWWCDDSGCADDDCGTFQLKRRIYKPSEWMLCPQ